MLDDAIFKSCEIPWSEEKDYNGDIALCSRVRLARNLAREFFPAMLSAEKTREITKRMFKRVEDIHNASFFCYDMAVLEAGRRRILQEKHLISPELAEGAAGMGVAVSRDMRVSIMINEEDHIRLQCFLPGLQLENAWLKASEIDDCLWNEEKPAFHGRFGYLTACPTNAGTGMRASVMLHLPALIMTGEAEALFSGLSRLGLTVRGIYGEGSRFLGNLFQVSNQISAGKSEPEILDILKETVIKIIESEKAARFFLKEKRPIMFYDKIWRACGILSYAESLSTGEMMEHISLLRLGADMGIIKNINMKTLNEITIKGQPAFLCENSAADLSTVSLRDWQRAKVVRTVMKNFGGERID